jgi:cytochrome d ubiquinol oxidase subunit II
MPTVWYILLAAMITVYVVLDGFDLGVGALHRVLARSDEEREATTGAIGPVWNGNEVWLIAGGGVLFLAFPRAYAAAFSGLYLGLILVLWLLIGRGLGLELRHQVDHPLWRIACDTVLWLASASLALVLGVALGNVVRGVPLRPDGYFHLALFDILNPYALAVGLFTLVLLAAHGANFLAFSAGGALGARARRLASRLWWAEVVLAAALAWPTVAVRPELPDHLADHPWRLIFPVLGLGALVALRLAQRAGALRRAFLASAAVLAGLLGTVAAGLYPAILPAHHDRPFGLTVDNAATSDHALRIAMWWWPVGIALATVYFVVAYRHFLGGRRPTIADV